MAVRWFINVTNTKQNEPEREVGTIYVCLQNKYFPNMTTAKDIPPEQPGALCVVCANVVTARHHSLQC